MNKNNTQRRRLILNPKILLHRRTAVNKNAEGASD